MPKGPRHTKPIRRIVVGRRGSGGVSGNIQDLPNQLPVTVGADPRTQPEPITEAPFPRRDPAINLYDPGSIYMPVDLLNRASQRTPAREIGDQPGVGSIIPINFGTTTVTALPFKVHQNTLQQTMVVLYRVGTNHRGASPVAVDSYLTIWIDGREHNISASPIGSWFTGAPLGTNGRMILYDGDGVQNVSTAMATYIPGYTDTLANYGIIGVMISTAAVGNKVPRVDVKIRGIQMKDYTTTGPSYTVQHSDLPANWLAWWIENIEGETVQTAGFETLADSNNETVPAGGTRRAGGISINRNQRAEVTRDVLRIHAGAFLIHAPDGFVAIADRPASPVATITRSELSRATKIEGPRYSSQPADVVVIWPDPDSRVDQRARAVGTLNGQITEVRMDGINNQEWAKREAIEIYNRLTLEGDQVTFYTRNEGIEWIPGDVVTLQDPDVGIGSGKDYRITRMAIPGDPGEWEIKGREYQLSRYSNSVAVDPLIGDTDLDNAAEPPAITGLTLEPQNEVTRESGVDHQMKISWTAPAYLFTGLIMIEVINNDVPGLGSRYFNVASDVTELVVESLQADTEYEIKIRIQSTIGVLGIFANGFETTLPDSLVAWWKFETVTDPQPDELGNYGLTESAASTPTAITGKVGNGVRLNNSSDEFYSEADGLANIRPPFTILGWARLTTAPTSGSYATITSSWPNNASDDRFILRVREDGGSYYYELRVRRDDRTLALYQFPAMTWTADTWQFFALSYGPDHYRLILDNNTPEYIQESIPDSRAGFADFTVGPARSISGNGRMAYDEIRVYRTALSVETIENIRAAEA